MTQEEIVSTINDIHLSSNEKASNIIKSFEKDRKDALANLYTTAVILWVGTVIFFLIKP